jgi:hypothetical protein
VVWSEGTTEPGSSGAGLFDRRGRYRGTLSGGFASCSLRTEPDWYGRFDFALPKVKRWLKQTPPTLAKFKRAKDSVEEDDWREYKVRIKKRITRFEVAMSGLSGAADLYVRSNSRANSNSFDCAPMADSKESERCILENRGATTYYLGVLGKDSGKTKFSIEPQAFNENATQGIGVLGRASSRVYLRFRLAGEKAGREFKLAKGLADWIPVSGDLNGNGINSVSAFDPLAGEFHLWRKNGPKNADTVIKFGPDGGASIPLLGDWDGDGVDTPGVYIPEMKAFELRNSNTSGQRDLRYRFTGAPPGSLPVVGDWNGDGVDTPGLYLPEKGLFRLYRSPIAKGNFKKVRFGPSNSKLAPVVGDWTGHGGDTVGLYDPESGKFALRYRNKNGETDASIRFGPKNGLPIAGRWKQ